MTFGTNAKLDDLATNGINGVPDSIAYRINAFQENAGTAALGRAVTAVLLVSPNGSGTDGLSWTTAYQTIQAALAVASTDADDCTLILISPHATNYNINTAGDPTFSGNYILAGTHRDWAKIKNEHASATSVLKFTGKASLINLNINLGESNNGVIMTHGGFRAARCQFIGEDLTSAKTALHIDGASQIKHGKVTGCDFLGEGTTQMTGLLVDNCSLSLFEDLRMHKAKTCIQIVENTGTSDENLFRKIDLGDSGIGLDIDAGDEQHFDDIVFHNNDTNVDDEVGNHIWRNIFGSFEIEMVPDNFTGVTFNASAAGDTWSADVPIRTATVATKPFRVVAVHSEANATEKFRMRFSADLGLTHYDDIQVEGNTNAIKREGSAFPSGTEFIFNKSTRISGSCKSESGGNGAVVWLEIQKI